MRFRTSLRLGGRLPGAGILALIGLCGILPSTALAAAQDEKPVVTVKVVQGGESKVDAWDVRQWVVGPGINEPDPFPGWGGPIGEGGTVAWGGVGRSARGTLVVAFEAGYWHVSPQTPFTMPQYTLLRYMQYGGFRTDVTAPTGGRIMFVRSEDGGKTWSKPRTMWDTPYDDRQAGLLALPDGTWLCSWFIGAGETTDPWKDVNLSRIHLTMVQRSFDDGRTWGIPVRMETKDFTPLQAASADGPAVLRKDGSIILTAYGVLHNPTPCAHPAEYRDKGACAVAGIFSSKDEGQTWDPLSVVKADHDLEESHTVELPDGRLVMVSRQLGDITWSSDNGKTWTPPVEFIHMAAPTLTVLPDGTLLCVYAEPVLKPGDLAFLKDHSVQAHIDGWKAIKPWGRLRATFSTDGGKTWIAPDPKYGFLVDEDAYGYNSDVVLPDGTVYISYQHTAIVTEQQVKDSGILAIRLRVRPDHSGIDLLPPDPDAVLGKNVNAGTN